jgi:hypothetical protein
MRRLTLTCALLAATALSAGPLGAAPLTIEDLATQALAGASAGEAEMELVPLTEAELADERGGFLTPFGEINFAATLTTIVNGQTALQTTLTLTEQGLQQQVSSFLPPSLQSLVGPAANSGGSNVLNNASAPSTLTQPVTTPESALTAGADALTPALTAINQATTALTDGLAQPGNPADDAPSLQDAGGVSSIASVLPAGPAQQVVSGLAGSIDGLVDAVTGYVPETPQTQTQDVAASQTTVYTPDVLPQTSAELQAAAAAAGINLGGLQGNGLVVPGEGGATAILHSVSTNALTNTVINTASNVDVQLHTEINLVMPGLENLQSEIAEAALTSSLHDAIGRALSGF